MFEKVVKVASWLVMMVAVAALALSVIGLAFADDGNEFAYMMGVVLSLLIVLIMAHVLIDGSSL